MSSTGPAGGHGPSAGQQNRAQGGASQLHGHYRYAKGAVEQTLGKVTGATGLQSAGRADQTAGLTEMRAAKQHHDIDPSTAPPVTSTSSSDTTVVGGGSRGEGMERNVDSGTRQGAHQPAAGGTGFLSMERKVERTMGDLVGCKGMQEEGAERVASAEALRRNQARGGGSGGIEGSGLGGNI